MVLSLKTLSPRRRLSAAFSANLADNAWLDCLRTLAITLVMLRHGQRILEASVDTSFWKAFKLNGWAGVDLFFVLSGYLVTAGLLRAFAERGCVNGVHYAMKRIRRIVPAYVFVLALVIAGYFPNFVVVGENLTERVVYHLVFMQDVLPSDINVVFWSLGVEAKYYAVIPIIVLLVSRASNWPVILSIGLAVVLLGPVLRWIIYVNNDIENYYVFWRTMRSPFYACLEPFALGFLVAMLEHRGILRLSPKSASRLFFLMICALVLFLGSHVLLEEIGVWDATIQSFFLALIFATLVAAATQMKPIQTPFEAVFRYGARISYSLYLVHFPLIPLSFGLANAYNLGAMGFWTFYICISLVHAIVILSYIESSFMKSKDDRLHASPVRTIPSTASPM